MRRLLQRFVYLRLHGREQLYASDYQENELRSYAEKIIVWMNKGKEVWVFFNNDYYGFAVKNAERLKEIIDRYELKFTGLVIRNI